MSINHQGNNPRTVVSSSPAKHVEVTEKPAAASKIERSRMVAEAVVQASSVFAAFDKDGDGKVSAAELRGSMTAALGEEVSEEEAAAILATVDADGDGLLDQEEFSRLGLGATGDDGGAAGGDDDEEVRRRCLKEAFAMYATGGGEEGARITPASLRRMLGKLLGSEKMGLEECRAMICRFDLNGDGVLSFDEFRVMMMANL
ncbi:probable calcium-binding protein CML25/26 [Triticum dicoccoides]|uniref:probable calcium-binding protein CML25/26 n=1 Tax=Triticum dicoccoides TaxID=85692 RepID=UPI00188FBD2D|nr:probable calcium-binding protein CML25/26 [Triticum dicoccoides]